VTVEVGLPRVGVQRAVDPSSWQAAGMDARENVRRAIDVMTAWTSDSGDDFTWSRLVQNVTDGPDADTMLLMGFVNLAGELGIRLEKATGQDLLWHLQEIAMRYL
jgi:hypothetical protein